MIDGNGRLQRTRQTLGQLPHQGILHTRYLNQYPYHQKKSHDNPQYPQQNFQECLHHGLKIKEKIVKCYTVHSIVFDYKEVVGKVFTLQGNFALAGGVRNTPYLIKDNNEVNLKAPDLRTENLPEWVGRSIYSTKL